MLMNFKKRNYPDYVLVYRDVLARQFNEVIDTEINLMKKAARSKPVKRTAYKRNSSLLLN